MYRAVQLKQSYGTVVRSCWSFSPSLVMISMNLHSSHGLLGVDDAPFEYAAINLSDAIGEIRLIGHQKFLINIVRIAILDNSLNLLQHEEEGDTDVTGQVNECNIGPSSLLAGFDILLR